MFVLFFFCFQSTYARFTFTETCLLINSKFSLSLPAFQNEIYFNPHINKILPDVKNNDTRDDLIKTKFKDYMANNTIFDIDQNTETETIYLDIDELDIRQKIIKQSQNTINFQNLLDLDSNSSRQDVTFNIKRLIAYTEELKLQYLTDIIMFVLNVSSSQFNTLIQKHQQYTYETSDLKIIRLTNTLAFGFTTNTNHSNYGEILSRISEEYFKEIQSKLVSFKIQKETLQQQILKSLLNGTEQDLEGFLTHLIKIGQFERHNQIQLFIQKYEEILPLVDIWASTSTIENAQQILMDLVLEAERFENWKLNLPGRSPGFIQKYKLTITSIIISTIIFIYKVKKSRVLDIFRKKLV